MQFVVVCIQPRTRSRLELSGFPLRDHEGDDLVFVVVDPSGRFVYIADRLAHKVVAYAINASTGALTPVPGSPFATGYAPNSVAVDPTGRFSDVDSGDSNGGVWAYAINASTGALTPVQGSPFAAGFVPDFVAVDPTGRFSYVANAGSNNISAYAINASTGALTPVPGSPFATGQYPNSVAVDPSRKFVYATNSGSNTVSA